MEIIEQRKVVSKGKILELVNSKKRPNRVSMWILTEQDKNVSDRKEFTEQRKMVSIWKLLKLSI
jgi:hypothetical protein